MIDQAKIDKAVSHCVALAKHSKPGTLAVMEYLESLITWTREERDELERRVAEALAD